MMPRMLLCLLTAATLGAAASAQAPQGANPPPPSLLLAPAGPDGLPVIQYVGLRQVQQEVQYAEVVGGVAITRTKTVMVPIHEVRQATLDSKDLQVFTGAGKRIPPGEVARRVKGPTAVVIAADGKMVDPLYRRILREDTLIVVLPAGGQLLNQPAAPLVFPRVEQVPPPR
jgi:hypothetical protein